MAEGLALGPIHLYAEDLSCVIRSELSPHDVPKEIVRYKAAHDSVTEYYEVAVEEAQRELGEEEAAILRSHQMILEDPYFKEELPLLVQKRLLNAEWLVLEGVQRLADTLGKSPDPYLRERVADVQDIGKQLIHRLLDIDWEAQMPGREGVVIVARDLAPSDIVRLKSAKILALVTDQGTPTSHSAIMARLLGIPVVMGAGEVSKTALSGDMLFVDGNSGLIHLNPDPRAIRRYHRKMQAAESRRTKILLAAAEPAITTDGVRITMLANIVEAEEASAALKAGAEGVGLFRTEMSFLAQGRLLSEDEQYEIYRDAVEGMKGAPVVIRTLDLGGDKLIPFMDQPAEANPFLGWRSLRVSLHHSDVFKVQLRAIVRASLHGPVKIMFPMISTTDELKRAMAILDEVEEEFAHESHGHAGQMNRGIMIEVPSAAIIIDALLPLVDFISVGTNDLVQYTLAVDRNNPRVSSYYRPADPSVIRLIRRTARWARRLNKPVSVCGEVAGQPRFAPLLIGLGISQLSMTPSLIPEVKHVIHHSSHEQSVALARRALRCSEASEVEEMLHEHYRRIPPM